MKERRSVIDPRSLPVLITLILFLAMFGAGSIAFTGFFSLQNFLNLFIDNAYLLILAVGMTFVIISGGIDLSVGSMLALSTMVASSLLEKSHLSPVFVIPIVLAMGTALGLFMGYLIQAFNLPPFIITLAGLYLARGLCYVVSIDTIAHPRRPHCHRHRVGGAVHIALHEIRTHRVRHRRKRAVRPADGASGGRHKDRDLRF